MYAKTDHRPWELPARSWSMAMRWLDLLFIHWPVSVEVLRPLIPTALEIDTFDGQAWIGVVPFRMTGIRPRFVPPLPGLSAFAEINVRTYVTTGGKPGVWFFSLDAAHRLAVWTARWRFNLPYYLARITMRQNMEQVLYQSARTNSRGGAALFAATYGPTGEQFQARRGTIDHWLTERYCLYAADHQGRVYRGDIHHQPWPLQPASAEIQVNTMTEPLGIALPRTTPLLHFARRIDAVAWSVEDVTEDNSSAAAYLPRTVSAKSPGG
jgi:uncharacterized protein YqjF (DUF2071 family)